ncbi:MAG: UpxY family transcription antiterminator [Bacteroidetes bacterium]|nr:UpxY family transcription antiterminator [Bacteroidota bacterium]
MTPTKSKVWYVIYTRSRSEKKVLADLTASGITCFVPMQKKLRQWKDRKKLVEAPLLPGYCFVHINRVDYDRVLHNQNVISYVIFEGKAAIVPDNQIERVREMVEQSLFPVEVSFENFISGQQVEIIVPPLTGLKGELVKTHGNNRFIIRIDSISINCMLDIPADGIVLIPTDKK